MKEYIDLAVFKDGKTTDTIAETAETLQQEYETRLVAIETANNIKLNKRDKTLFKMGMGIGAETILINLRKKVYNEKGNNIKSVVTLTEVCNEFSVELKEWANEFKNKETA